MSINSNVTLQIRRGLKENLPASAREGELLFCTDTLELYIGTGTSVVLLIASGSNDIYIHNQTPASALWEITHNLGKIPNIIILNNQNEKVEAPIKYIDTNKVEIRFSPAFAGKAYLN